MAQAVRVMSAAAVLLMLAVGQSVAAAQGAAPAPTAAGAPSPQQLKDYEAFRFWLTKLPAEEQKTTFDGILQRYGAELRAQGRSDADVRSLLDSLRTTSQRAEVERWNQILTAAKPNFNTAPNAFLVEVTRGVTPGRALDVGMGQGRNTIFLAQQGWDAVGFDPAERAVAAAQEQAAKLGVKMTTVIAGSENFAWGDSQWDLIVLSYVSLREIVPDVVRALKPGGMVVVEGFHRDATRTNSIGGGVVFDSNELLRLFSGLRVIRYEDTMGVADFGRAEVRLVRFAGMKP
jgi:SAM-dependent methyltransferase